MDSRQETFFSEISGKRAAILGLGVTNAPLAALLASKGCEVTVFDRRSREALGKYTAGLEELGVSFRLGEDHLKSIDADIIFRTPGMSFNLPELREYRRRGIVVTSEMEVFFELCPAHIIAVTGSNGKTTASTVIAKMLRNADKTVWLGGNIGKAMLPDVEKMRREHYAVCELSSFQLISMRRSPQTAVITNITPNHLDVHKDMDEYINAKRNILLHQNADGRLVLNADCPVSSGFADDARGAVLTFSRRSVPEWGAYLRNNDICFVRGGDSRRIMSASDIKIPGMHNIENYLAAICACEGLVSDEDILLTARTFGGVEHRIQLVREHRGVRWYNDSIATTPSRTISGMLSLFEKKIILIAGGSDKNIPFDELGPAVCKKVSVLILIGASAESIEAAVRACPFFESSGVLIYRAAALPEAVAIASRLAGSGDCVALSPACASFDMYSGYEERGRHFCRLVNELN